MTLTEVKDKDSTSTIDEDEYDAAALEMDEIALKNRAINLTNKWGVLLCDRLNYRPLPKVIISFKNFEKDVNAKTIYLIDEGYGIIQYSLEHLRRKDLERTVIHEIAHLIHFDKITRSGQTKIRKPHGKEWKRIFKLSGFSPDYDFEE